MNKTYIALSLASIISLGLINTNARAELALPSGIDKRPDLSLDPFERARAAMRKLPTSKPKDKSKPVEQAQPKKQPSQQTEPQQAEQDIQQPASKKNDTPNKIRHTTNFKDTDTEDAFEYELAITMDAFSLTSGGIQQTDEDTPKLKQTGVVGVVDFIAEVDTGAAGLWDDGLFYLYSALTFGETPTVGDLHGISSIEAGVNTMHIMELWYEHSFPYSHSSILFGLHDFNNEFYIAEYAQLFVNGAFGMGQALSEAANPSTYPLTTLGVRLKSEVTENTYFQITMHDAVIQKEELDKIISIKLDKNEGVFVGAETGIFKNEPGNHNGYYKIAAGLWYLKGEQLGFADANGVPILTNNPKPGTGGAYFLAETSIGEKMGLFFKHGRARADYNQYSQFYAAGLNFSGAIPGREEDVLGIGLVHTRQSSAYLSQFDSGTYYVAETTYEITYSAQIMNWLMVQPDYQYVQYPSMDPNIVKASVIGVRLQAVF